MAKTKLVYGAGLNDADYVPEVKVFINGKQKRIWYCPFFITWRSMLQRCFSQLCQSRHPTYINCSVSPEWLLFSEFRKWMNNQPWEGNDLDKDILHPGNKQYGPDKCVFVSTALNNFLLDRGASRGNYPIGVSFHKQRSKFIAQCRNPFTGKKEFLGYFNWPDEAHEAWRKRKHELACIYADMQTDERIAEALRKRYANSETNK